MMAATIVGTPTAVIWATGQNPAGQSITIPTGTTAVYMFWSFYNSTSGLGIGSVTLNSNNPSQSPFEITTAGGGNFTGTGVAAWYNPAVGSRTLDVEWDASSTEGPTTIVAYVQGGDTTSWRDADAGQVGEGTQISLTLTTVSGDLVLKYDQRYSGLPSLTSGWSDLLTTSNRNHYARLSSISATGSTQVCTSEDEYYSSLVAISIPSAAGGGKAHSHYYRMLNS